jgi:hypothetical protein
MHRSIMIIKYVNSLVYILESREIKIIHLDEFEERNDSLSDNFPVYIHGEGKQTAVSSQININLPAYVHFREHMVPCTHCDKLVIFFWNFYNKLFGIQVYQITKISCKM